jgi:hypothetical protein
MADPLVDAVTGELVVDPETRRPLSTPAQLELATDEVRGRLAVKPPKDAQVKTPDAIIEDLEFSKWAAAHVPMIIREADRTVRVLQRRYSAAFVVAVKRSEAKASEERRLEAEVALAPLLAQVDAAEVALEYAKRVAKSVESATSAVQTQAAMVRVTYGLAGTGRES